MEQFKVLERLHSQLRTYSKFGFWSDGDEVFDNLVKYSPAARRDYTKDRIAAFDEELSWIPENTRESRLEAILESLSRFWNDAREYNEDTGDGIGCEQTFITIVKCYYEFALKFTAIAYYRYLTTKREGLIDFYSWFPSISSQLLAHTLAYLNICRAQKFIKTDQTAQAQFAQQNDPQHDMVPTVIDTACKEKQSGAEYLFNSPQAQAVYAKLAKAGFIKSPDGLNYDWQSTSKEMYSYLCYRMSKMLLGDECQIESKLFCAKIRSSFNQPTIARYARLYKEGIKTIDEEAAKQIDAVFK